MLFVKEGDICSVPFNIACGRCRMCNEGKTGICLNVNPARAGAAYGYVDMGGWIGGQAEYVMVPFADFNLLRFPDRDQALEKILDLTMLSDIFPTGYHGAYTAGVRTGSTAYVAGAGPVGLAAAYAAQLLGASVVIVGDMNADRLAQAQSFGCETVDLSSGNDLVDMIEQIVGEPEVDAAVDAVGFEAKGHGAGASEAPATVLNDIMTISRAGASLGIPGLYVTGDPGGIDENAKVGQIGVKLGLGWAKSHSFVTGQCPVKRYNRQLMNMILSGRAQIAKAVNAERISLDEAPRRLPALRPGRGQEVRHRPPRDGGVASSEAVADPAPAPFSGPAPSAYAGRGLAALDGSRVSGATGRLRPAGPRRPRRCRSSAASPGRSRRRR